MFDPRTQSENEPPLFDLSGLIAANTELCDHLTRRAQNANRINELEWLALKAEADLAKARILHALEAL